MVLLDQFFCDNFFVKITFGIQIVLKFIQRMQMIDILLKYILWYEFQTIWMLKGILQKKLLQKKRVK